MSYFKSRRGRALGDAASDQAIAEALAHANQTAQQAATDASLAAQQAAAQQAQAPAQSAGPGLFGGIIQAGTEAYNKAKASSFPIVPVAIGGVALVLLLRKRKR